MNIDGIHTAASVLSVDPPIIYVRPRPQPFGLAGLLAARNPGLAFTCLVRTMWTLEAGTGLAEVTFTYHRFRELHPHIAIHVMANTETELALLKDRGINAVLANHNMFVDETVFRPRPEIQRVYDAVYNANFSPFKRRELAAEIPRCVHIGYAADPESKDDMRGAFLAARALLPRHHFLNPHTDDSVKRLGPNEVNHVLVRAHVGLCLSEVEGPMVASIEYLMAGLPVVTTPNTGGRDRYFTGLTALVAEPNPRAIRLAVEAMRARAIPPDAVRETTLKLVDRDRATFNDFIGTLRQGRPAIGSDARWPFDYTGNLYKWKRVVDFARMLGLAPEPAAVIAEAPWYAGDETA